jgi:PAS domain S-box-containing protein
MLRREKALGDFGEFAQRSDDLNKVLTQACRLVAEVLGTGQAKVLEIEEGGTSLFVRAGVGWNPDIVGKVRLPLDEHSSENFAIKAGKPVIMEDLRQEQRFDVPAYMKEAGVQALANVPIFLPGHRTYGLLQVDATEPRDFGDEDTEFLRTYTTILGPVIDRLLNLQVMNRAEERFRHIVEGTRDYAIFLTDAEDRITDWLPGAEAVYGFTVAEALGQPAAILFTPEDREQNAPQIEVETARLEGAAPNVRWHVRKGGGRVFIDGAVSALYDADGVVRGFLKIGQDVTARRRSEAALRESEARHRLLIGSWAQAVWEVDANGVVVADSPSWRAYTGQTVEEWLGNGWFDAIHPDERAYAERQWREAIAARGFVDAEFRVRAPDGSWRWTNVRAAPVLDATGRIEKWVGMNIDISARKRAEWALIHSEGQLRDLVEGVSQLVWRAIDGSDWIWASPQWTAFTGQSEVDSHDRGWLEPVHPDDRPIALAAWDKAGVAGGFEVEYRIRNAATGTYRWFQTRAAPRRDARGEVVEWLGTSTDVHQLKALQQSQAVMVAELQHRTRNLIAVVRGIADDTMEQTGPTEAFRLALGNRLSALSRVQGLLSRAEVEPVTLAAVVHLELDALGAGASGDRVRVAGPDVWLRNSTVQTLALALHELATNARKYGALSHDRGQLAVTWSEHHQAGERRLMLEWIETGLEHAPQRTQPVPDGSGYGRELIEQALPHALGARTTYRLTETGVRCTIDLPSRPDPHEGETP